MYDAVYKFLFFLLSPVIRIVESYEYQADLSLKSSYILKFAKVVVKSFLYRYQFWVNEKEVSIIILVRNFKENGK